MPINLKKYCRETIESAGEMYRKDLDALPEEALLSTSGGASRSPVAITYEIIVVNKRLATRMKGDDPGPFDPTAWANVPEEFTSADGCKSAFMASIRNLLSTLEAVPSDQMDKDIATPSGSTTPFDLALFAAQHVSYHDGQLNLLQAQRGDADMHWQD
jgi:hypothetical protein